jgi:hypothetical protein
MVAGFKDFQSWISVHLKNHFMTQKANHFPEFWRTHSLQAGQICFHKKL